MATTYKDYPIEYVTVEGNLQNGMVPVWIDDGKNCYWSVMQLPTGTIDCTFVQNCMQSIIDGINNQINDLVNTVSTYDLKFSHYDDVINDVDNRMTNIETTITNIQNDITNLQADSHTHSNKALLDTIKDDGDEHEYLGGDGLYHMLNWYQITSTGNNVNPQPVLEFDDTFVVIDDPDNNRTVISVRCCDSSSGGTTDGNDYVVSGTYDSSTQVLTLNRTNGTVSINLNDLLNKSDDVYVDTATFDSSNNRLTLTRTDGTNIIVDLSDLSIREYSQTVSSSTSVNINHGLGRHPSFVPVDSAGMLVIPESVHYVDGNNVTITFDPAFTGTIYWH